MELTDELKTLFVETAKRLKGFERRRFQAQTVKALGHSGQRLAERELGWDRKTLRKAMHELKSGLQCFDAISTRRRRILQTCDVWSQIRCASTVSRTSPLP